MVGAAIGGTASNATKPAGLRTHMLVSLGAALSFLSSLYTLVFIRAMQCDKGYPESAFFRVPGKSCDQSRVPRLLTPKSAPQFLLLRR
jgi:hypothetical protein